MALGDGLALATTDDTKNHHHRLKTFSDWTYTRVAPDAYLWRSPHGYAFLKDRTGTRDLTPRPVEPPGRH